MNKSKVALLANAALGKLLTIIGYVAGIFSLFMVIGSLVYINGEGMRLVLNMFLFTLVVSVLMIITGARIKRTIKRFKQYISLISGQNMTLLENIAANTNHGVDFVNKDLNKMIKKGFFTNARIDETSREIIIAGHKTNSVVTTQLSSTTPTEMETYICAGCDAHGSKPKGTQSSCEYCGNAV